MMMRSVMLAAQPTTLVKVMAKNIKAQSLFQKKTLTRSQCE